MGQPQARMTDLHSCVASYGVPVPILPPCAPTVLVGCLPAARILDQAPVPHPIAAAGSFTVIIQSLPAARMGDPCPTGGATAMGCFTVLTG